MTKPKRERTSLRMEAETTSPEGRLLNYLKQDPILPPRDAALRALRAFYMPWALEDQLEPGQLRSLAATAVEELQFRIFQIQQRYGVGESAAFITPTPRTVGLGAPHSSLPPTDGPAPTIAEMREQINAADLDDF